MTPMPPPHLAHPGSFGAFSPADGFDEWARAMFIDEGSELENETYAHLRGADLGFVWTNSTFNRRGQMLIGQCELVADNSGPWSKMRGLHQLRTWFGGIPDFVITFYAPWWAESDERARMAVTEHELHHAGQAKDEFGSPKFSRDSGLPIFALRGHDFEEFTGVVERYGATSPALRTAAEAIMAGPLFSDHDIRIACATCAAR